jgi:AraC-like DNA-binding protein
MKRTNENIQQQTPGTKWLDRLHQLFMKQMAIGNLSNNTLALQMGTSERHFIRQMKAFTGYPPQQYLRRYRLRLAKEYLLSGKFRTVKETAAAVGFSTSSYFICQFEKEFGQKPLEVLRKSGWR